MITRRFFFRVDRALNFTNKYQVQKPVRFIQKCYFYDPVNCYWKMSGEKSKQSVGDWKRMKSAAPVWRPVSTQSHTVDVKDVKVEFHSSHNLGDGEKLEITSQVKEVNYRSSIHYSGTRQVVGENKLVTELVEANISPTALEDSDEGREPKGESVPSVEKHSLSVEVGSSLFRFVKGKGGSVQEKIEEEMGVKIKFPSSKKDECIIVEGISADSVARASERIQIIIDEAVKSPTLDYSHFISLPLAIHPELVDKLVNFQNSILGVNFPFRDESLDSDSNEEIMDDEDAELQSDIAPQVAVKLKAKEDIQHVKVDITSIPLVGYPPKVSTTSTMQSKVSTISDLGIEKSIFIKPKTFHLTVLMLKLWNKERVDASAEILQSVAAEVRDALEGRPVSIRLKGLECMKGSLAKARVLYAPVEEVGGEGRLLRACKTIIDAFIKGGLVLEKDAKQTLKLHATLMNARHRKRKTRSRKFDSFDARSIMKQYGSEDWGEYLVREAHLSQRFVFDENGYYHCCASIPFPENTQLD